MRLYFSLKKSASSAKSARNKKNKNINRNGLQPTLIFRKQLALAQFN